MDDLGFIKGENDISISTVSAFPNDFRDLRNQLQSRDSQFLPKIQEQKVVEPMPDPRSSEIQFFFRLLKSYFLRNTFKSDQFNYKTWQF